MKISAFYGIRKFILLFLTAPRLTLFRSRFNAIHTLTYYFFKIHLNIILTPKGGYTLVTLPRIVTLYRDSVDETRARVTYQKLVKR
jgi:hypothetical protein